MSKRWTPSKKTVELAAPVRPSRIRREPVRAEPEVKRRRRTREEELWLGIAGIVLMGASCAALAIGVSNATSQYSASTEAPAASAEHRFQHCYSAGATGADCVRDGGTISIGGEEVKLALDAPRISGAACAGERRRGILAATRLRDLLNSGEVALAGTVRQADGASLQAVTVDGRDVAKAMIAAGVARTYGSSTGWCS